MLLLQSLDASTEYAQLDENTLEVKLLARNSKVPPNVISGHFAWLHGQFVALFRHGQGLQFLSGKQLIQVGDRVRSELRMGRSARTFRLTRDQQVLFEQEYSASEPDPSLQIDPTPFVEEEDFDVFMFIHNVLSEPSRRRRIYASSTDS
jgi:hypothetical protein